MVMLFFIRGRILNRGKIMILKTLRKFDSGVADVFDSGNINLEKFEIVYIKRQLEKKLDDLIPFFPDLNPDSDDPKIYNLISTFRQSLTHVLATRKKTSEELVETVLSTVEDVYRELDASGSDKSFPYRKKSNYLKELKKGNNPRYNVNGVEIQMDRYAYYSELSLFSGKNVDRKEFGMIKDKYDPELSLLMETIHNKKR